MSRSGVVSEIARWIINAAILLFSPFVLSACVSNVSASSVSAPNQGSEESGILVLAADQETHAAVDDVVVRVTNSSFSDGVDYRELHIPACEDGQFVFVSAKNYETTFSPCTGANTYYFFLKKLNENADDINYAWSSADDCGGCHAKQIAAGYDEIAEWEHTAHAKVFIDPYFINMYRGTNTNGQTVAPGFKLDYPNDPGQCAYCHAPTTIRAYQPPPDLSFYYPPQNGTNGEGVTCDICHKVLHVDNNPNLLPPIGIGLFRFLRSSSGFVMGPFSNILTPLHDDSKNHESSCASLLSKSEFCAACHYGQFNNVTIYNSYGEWQQSVYSKNPTETSYRTCQDCHMLHLDVNDVSTLSSARSACAETSVRFQDFNHNLMDTGPDEIGSETPRMIKHAARLTVKLKYEPNKNNALNVRVEVENIAAGHKFPTDSPLRHLILVVSATDQFDIPLQQLDSQQIPAWAGTRDVDGMQGYAGQPGVIYANLLDSANPLASASFWKMPQMGQPLDTRLPPRQPQLSTYSFAMPDLGEVHISVKLIYRFAFIDLMEQKGWNRPDIIVSSIKECSAPSEPYDEKICTE